MNMFELVAAVETQARVVLREGFCIPHVKMAIGQLVVVATISRRIGQVECRTTFGVGVPVGADVRREIQTMTIAAMARLEKVRVE